MAVKNKIRSSLLGDFSAPPLPDFVNIPLFCFNILFSFSLSFSADDGCKSKNQAKREKRRPPGTVEFTVSKTTAMAHSNDTLISGEAVVYTDFHLVIQVGPKDSLNSIALKFNITPNKLVQLNKLFSRSVYPGQVRTSSVAQITTAASSLIIPLTVAHHSPPIIAITEAVCP